MEFSFTDEQRAISALATSIFRKHCGDDDIRVFAQSNAPYDAPLWRQLQSSGLLSLALPEPFGGALGLLELVLVLEQQGRFLAPVPIWRNQLVALAIAAFGDAALRAGTLPDLASGTCFATLGEDCVVQARREGAIWVLNGHATAVPLVSVSAHILLPAETDQGTHLFLLRPDQQGVVPTDGVLTHGEPVADMHLDAVRVAQTAVLAGPDIEGWLNQRVALCVAALQLGVAQEALARTARHVSERKQFGRPIGSFQAVALRAADAYIDVELARIALWDLAVKLDAGRPAAQAAHIAKYWASQCGHRVSHAAQHLHGGLGADTSFPLHRFFLWSRALELTGGGASRHLFALGRLLAGQP
jgi:3-oxocholest-4-en-26-oyl-CoA dehydrogenase beta subunit